ncbi:MAG: LysM peptidoglycan-binding domain-containing protein [Caldilineaceae bacterium]|nr:LysM peptidoglycan-binding domain-containing protein [Caldilineaceae bacterium]
MNTPLFRCFQLSFLRRGLILLILCGAFMLVDAPGETAAAENDVVHIVQAGETLSGIAQRYRVGLRQLANYNGITNYDRIRVGQRLRIPPTGVSPASAPTITPGPRLVPLQNATPAPPIFPVATPAPRSAAGATAAPARSGEVSYVVYAGDSLTGIGARFGVSASAIIERNRLPSTRIYVGQRLIIPVNSQAIISSPPTPMAEFQTNLPSVSNQEAPIEQPDPSPATDEGAEGS